MKAWHVVVGLVVVGGAGFGVYWFVIRPRRQRGMIPPTAGLSDAPMGLDGRPEGRMAIAAPGPVSSRVAAKRRAGGLLSRGRGFLKSVGKKSLAAAKEHGALVGGVAGTALGGPAGGAIGAGAGRYLAGT